MTCISSFRFELLALKIFDDFKGELGRLVVPFTYCLSECTDNFRESEKGTREKKMVITASSPQLLSPQTSEFANCTYIAN